MDIGSMGYVVFPALNSKGKLCRIYSLANALAIADYLYVYDCQNRTWLK